MPSGQDYASRLREETRQTLATHIRGLEEELRSFQENLSASLAPIARRLGSIFDIEIPAVEGIVAEAVAEEAREGARRHTGDMLCLARFAYNIRRKETQDEILNSLLDGAHRYAPRLALFVTRGNQFIGWSSRGFEGETAQKIGNGTLVLTECPLLRRALEVDGLSTANDLAQEPVLSQMFHKGVEGPLHAFPMKAIGRPVAVLLASPAEGHSCDLESLCILMDLTGLCVENLALKILHELKMASPAAPAPIARPAAPEPAAATVFAAAVSLSGSAAAESSAPSMAEAPAPRVAPAETTHETAAMATPLPQTSEAPEAAESVEPQGGMAATAELAVADQEPAEQPVPLPGSIESTAEEQGAATPIGESAHAVAEHVAVDGLAPSPEPHEPTRTSVLREVQPLTEEEKLHADAKRFARLLASEIKLYNEQRVREGRANRDLYVRLKRDIDRSRDMYEKRISPTVSRKVDYFHDEIIRVLGDNDPSTLGSDYPGPRVES